MNFSDIIPELQSALAEKYGNNTTVSDYQTIGGGCINQATKITTSVGTFFVKWNRNCASDLFIREAESLNELRKAAGNHIIIPEVIAVKPVTDTPGFLVQEFLSQKFSENNDEFQLGRGLAFIHKFSNEKYGFNHDNYCGETKQLNTGKSSWLVFFRENRLRYLISLINNSRKLSVSELDIYDKFLNKLNILIPEESTPSLIHGDLWSGNFMITKKGPALIDPASYYADREMEFGIITMFGGFSFQFYEGYNEIFPLDKNWKERNKIYQLYHILNHYFLFGGGYGNQALNIAKSFL